MKKLIFVAQALWIGGIETALVNLLNRLDCNKYEVTCLILHDSQELANHLPKQCRLIVADRDRQISFSEPYTLKKIYHLMEKPNTDSKIRLAVWKMLRFFLQGIEADRYASYIRCQLSNEHFDTCIIYSDRCAETAIKAVNAKRFLLFYHHGAMRKEYHDEYGYRFSKKIIAVSEPLAQKLREYRPKYAKKIIAINNIVDVDGVRVKSLEETAEMFSKEKFNIVSCGRIAKEKGLDLVANACAILLKEGIDDIEWWIVGGGPEETALHKLITTIGIENQVHFLGMKENPYPYIRKADLYIQTSRFEGHSVTLMEARVLAKPILATKEAAQGQIVDGVTGVLCKADAGIIAEKIRELHDNAELCNTFQLCLRAHDFEEDNKKIMERLEKLI